MRAETLRGSGPPLVSHRIGQRSVLGAAVLTLGATRLGLSHGYGAAVMDATASRASAS